MEEEVVTRISAGYTVTPEKLAPHVGLGITTDTDSQGPESI